MIMYKICLITSLAGVLLFPPAPLHQPPAGNAAPLSARISGPVETELQAMNKKRQQFFLNGEADSLVSHYADSFSYMPEFKPAIVARSGLRDFYRQWFSGIRYTTYEKQIYRVEQIKDYVLEIGYFKSNFTMTAGQPKTYNGKYMIMWQRDKDSHQLKILSEAFGADSYIGPADVPYAGVTVTESFILDKNRVSAPLLPEIDAIDQELLRTITTGDGKGRANGFLDNAIYMPHFERMLEGKEVLLPYLVKTYVADAKLYATNTYQEIFNTGDFVFLNGHFKGGYGEGTTAGTFEGNMTNLMKRDKDGQLRMYCQLVNNDR